MTSERRPFASLQWLIESRSPITAVVAAALLMTSCGKHVAEPKDGVHERPLTLEEYARTCDDRSKGSICAVDFTLLLARRELFAGRRIQLIGVIGLLDGEYLMLVPHCDSLVYRNAHEGLRIDLPITPLLRSAVGRGVAPVRVWGTYLPRDWPRPGEAELDEKPPLGLGELRSIERLEVHLTEDQAALWRKKMDERDHEGRLMSERSLPGYVNLLKPGRATDAGRPDFTVGALCPPEPSE